MLSTLFLSQRSGIGHIRHKLLTTTATVAIAVTASLPAHADDSEVFFGQVSNNSSVHPNVLFVLDTSRSMHDPDPGQEGSRLDRMKEAMETILDDATNVNVGLMRFNSIEGGSSVIYPITPINEVICGPGFPCGPTSITSSVRISADDSEQYNDPNDPKTNNTSDLYIGLGQEAGSGRAQIVGQRFRSLTIPQGATITSARMIFTAGQTKAEEVNLKIVGEDVNHAVSFKNDDNHLGGRLANATTAEVDWKITEPWQAGTTYESPDVSNIVQEIVNRPGWCGGNSLSMMFTGTGNRVTLSDDAGSDIGAKLVVTYDADSIPSDGGCLEKTLTVQVSTDTNDAQELLYPGSYTYDHRMYRYFEDIRLPLNTVNSYEWITAFRFEDLPIPKGADIRRADLQLVTSDQTFSGDSTVEIKLENSTLPNEIRSTRGNLSNRNLLTDSLDWTFPDANDMPAGSKVRSGDFDFLVQDLVGSDSWNRENNGLMIVLKHKSGTGTRWFKSFDKEPSAAAKLRIRYRENIGITRLTAKDELKGVVANLSAIGGTPIAGAYLEAANYYLGNEVDFGRTRGSANAMWRGSEIDERHGYHRVSHPDSYIGTSSTVVVRDPGCTGDYMNDPDCKTEEITGPATYISPLASSCQSNHIVFLSDGAPSESVTPVTDIKNLTGKSNCEGSGEKECVTELAEWLNTTDHVPGLVNTQSITTYTIGFNLESDFLEDIAAAGGGRYFKAASASELTNVFDDILADVLSVDTSFVAPGATVNQFNRLTHDQNIYFALFQPNKRPTWEGNIKRYQLASVDGETTIVDRNQNPAVNEDSGFFKTLSQSLWSDSTDGHDIQAGGAAHNIELNYTYAPTNTLRRAYTFTGDSSELFGNNTTANLTDAAHRLNENNALITDEMLNIEHLGTDTAARAAYRNSVLQWTRGVDILDEDQDGDNTEARRHIGDPMHSRPLIVNYERAATGNPTSGTDADTAESQRANTTIYLSTNEGYLHAIDQETGKELFSFMPQELLRNLSPNFENVTTASRTYGLDGSMSLLTNDDNNNVIVDGNEKAFLYFGMRRGGRNIYALDITDRHDPKLAWVIKGGVGGTPGFENLGESWSRMVPNTIFHNGVPVKVLTFSAGYDANQDPKDGDPQRSTDNDGRGLYMVNAETGAKIWSGGGIASNGSVPEGFDKHFPNMTYSIPATPRIIDVDSDGYADQIYVGDMGGRVWRFDIAKYHTQGELVKGGIIADLSGSDPTATAGERRFYSEPDVALISHRGHRFLNIGIASGWRAHPLDDVVNDRYYALRTKDILSAPVGYGTYRSDTDTYTPITEADMDDHTEIFANSSNEHGWFIRLEREGEKVLGSSITVNNVVLFTAYLPEEAVEDCSPAIGTSSYYALNVLGGQPIRKVEKDDGTTEDPAKEHRFQNLKRGGIPPDVTVYFTDDGIAPAAGAELLDLDIGIETERTFWLDKSKAGRSHAESAFD